MKTRISENSESPKQNIEFSMRKRNLPHWEQGGSVYFITCRTFEGFRLPPEAMDIVLDNLRFNAGKKYHLYGCAVMESHVHVLLLPLEKSANRFYSLSEITHTLKSYTANRIQRILQTKGTVWTEESYDRIIRNEAELLEKMNYIICNPVKAKIVARPEEYRWFMSEGFDQCYEPWSQGQDSQARRPVVPE